MRTILIRTLNCIMFGLWWAPPAWAEPPSAGFTVGARAGYASGEARVAPAARAEPGRFGAGTGGLATGYARPLGPHLLLGIDGDVWFPSFFDDDDRLWRSTASGLDERLDAFGSLRGRLGWVLDQAVVYGTAGGEWSLGRLEAAGLPAAERRQLHLGWAAGGGVAVGLVPGWTVRLEYLHQSSSPPGTRASAASRLTADLLALGLDARLDGFSSALAELADGVWAPALSVHGQATVVAQGYPGFAAAYQAPNSLSSAAQLRETVSATAFVGARLWRGGELYFNPELMQGFGLSDVHGVAAFPNGEAQKSSFLWPRFNAARFYFSQRIALGAPDESVDDGPNQIAGRRSGSRLSVVVGKFAVTDFFLVNRYAADPRTGFLNWNVYGGGSYDLTMDKLSWTWGGVVELSQRRWAFRAGYFLLPVVSNSNTFDTQLFEHGQYVSELELRFAPAGRPGSLKLFGWLNRGTMGSYDAALAARSSAYPTPQLSLTRETRVNAGVVVSAEQELTDELGVFARASFSPGQVEIMGWTDCDQSASLGAALKGGGWGRPADALGLAGVVEGLSPAARRYFAAGGMGILIGDGRLSYRPEAALELYYAFTPTGWATITADYQLIVDPGYNADRAPLSVFSARLHAWF